MKIIIYIFLFVSMIHFALAQNCDYSIEILVGNSSNDEDFDFKVRAVNHKAILANTSVIVMIEKGHPIKIYKPWTNISIPKQKTSSNYSPNLEPGNYKILAEIFVQCDDSDLTNNIAVRELTITERSTNTQKPMLSTQEQEQINKKDILEQDNYIHLSTNEVQKPFLEYKSSALRSKELVLYILLAVSIILNIILIIKR